MTKHRTADVTAGPGGVMTAEAGVITGELTLRTELSADGKVTLRVQYKDADAWYTVQGGTAHLSDPADLDAVHTIAVALLDRTHGCADRAGGPAGPVELRPHLVGVGALEVVEDGQGTPPDLAGARRVAPGLVGVAEVGEDLRLVGPVPGLPEPGQGLFVTGDGALVGAEVVVGVAEAVPGRGRAVAVAKLLVERERLFAVGDRLDVVAQLGVRVPDHVERARPAEPVARGHVQLQGPLVLGEGILAPALELQHPAETGVDVRLARKVAQLLEQVQRLAVMHLGLVVAAHPRVPPGQDAVAEGLAAPVGQALGGVEGSPLRSHQVGQVAPHVEEGRQGPGQLPGVPVEAGARGPTYRREQRRPFPAEPGR